MTGEFNIEIYANPVDGEQIIWNNNISSFITVISVPNIWIEPNELSLTIEKGDTIWDVVNEFIKQYPTIKKDKKFIMVSKNNIFTTKDTKIMDGDEITFSPPVVSGG